MRDGIRCAWKTEVKKTGARCCDFFLVVSLPSSSSSSAAAAAAAAGTFLVCVWSSSLSSSSWSLRFTHVMKQRHTVYASAEVRDVIVAAAGLLL